MYEHYIIKGETLTNIADAIREKTGKTDNINPKEIASGVNEVYEAGKQAEYDAFWDVFQNEANVSRDGYQYAFMWSRWNDENFKPKYDIKGKNFYYAFFGTGIRDIPACLERQGVKLDTSQATAVAGLFRASKCLKTPSVDLRSNATSLVDLYYSCWSLNTIGTIIIKDDGSQVFNNTCFYDTPSLKNITFEGIIGGSLNFSYSPLTVESMKNIITHLKNYAGTENSGKYTLTLKDSCKTLMAEQGAIEEFGNKTYDQYITDIGWNLA